MKRKRTNDNINTTHTRNIRYTLYVLLDINNNFMDS